MRIVIATGMYPPHGGGAERATELLAEGLSRIGHEVTVVASADECKTEEVRDVRVVCMDACGGWIGHVVRWPFPRRAFWNLCELASRKRARKTLEMIEAFSPELVITANTKGLGGLLPRRLRDLPAPHIHVVHDFEPVEPIMLAPGDRGDRFRNRVWSAVSRWRWGDPELVVFPSEWLCGLTLAHGVFSGSKSVVLPNPIAAIPPSKTSSGGDGGFKMIFVGALEPHKGALWLARTLVAAAPSESWSLDIVGDGGEREALEVIARQDGRIRVHGRKDGAELEAFWDAADALVVPSRCLENAPLVILEASFRKLPILAADVGGISESVTPGENGWLYDPNDVKSFREGVKTASSAEERAKLRWEKMPKALSPEGYAAEVLSASPLPSPGGLRYRCVDCGKGVEGGRCRGCGRDYVEKDRVIDFLPSKMSGFKLEEARYHDEATADAGHIHQLDSFRNAFYHRRAVSRLRPVAPGGWVLELACGSGHDGEKALRAGVRLLETDISGEAARLAWRRLATVEGAEGRFAVAVVDAEDVPLADRSLAGAFMVASLHHAEDPGKVLAEMRRVLAPGAAFVAAIEPNSLYFGALNRLKPALERVLGKRADKSVADEEHDGFSAAELSRMFEAAGFERVRVEPVWFLAGFLHYALQFATRLLRRKRQLAVPVAIERALVAVDEILFRVPGFRHLAWHWIASGRVK